MQRLLKWGNFGGLCLLLLLSGCGSSGDSIEWGVYQEPIQPQELPKPTGEKEIQVLWKKSLGAGAEHGYSILRPAYGNDGIYAASRDGRVFKLAFDSGAVIWQRDLKANIFSGVGVGDSIATVALDNGKVVALAVDTGDIRWETPLNRQISAIPSIGFGRVIMRTADGLILGLDTDNGEIAWTYETTVPYLSIHGAPVPVISGNMVFIGLANGKLIANDAVTGAERWENQISFAKGRNEIERLTDVDTPPLITSTSLYAATYQGNVISLNLQTAEEQWKAKVSSRLPMALGNEILLVTDQFGAIVAINRENGDIMWTQSDFRGHGMSRPLVIGNRGIVGDSKGNIYSLDLRDGTLLEQRKVVNGAVVRLIAGEDQFVVFSDKGNLTAVSLKSLLSV